jgi:Uma2 family endonuclease
MKILYIGVMEKYAIKLPKHRQFTDEEFYAFCQENRDLKFERTAKGEIIIMSPTGGITGSRNSKLMIQLGIWNSTAKSGEVFDSSTGFRLPNGAIRSPDAAWVEKSRWEVLNREEQEKFPPLCPDFIVELMSASDDLKEAQEKMEEWMENGCQLGWLIYPKEEKVFVYEAGQVVEEIQGFDHLLKGKQLLQGFVLDPSLLR